MINYSFIHNSDDIKPWIIFPTKYGESGDKLKLDHSKQSKTVYYTYTTPYWKPWIMGTCPISWVSYWQWTSITRCHMLCGHAFESKGIKMLVICGIVKPAERFHMMSQRSGSFWTRSIVVFPSATPSEATRWLCKSNLIIFLNWALITWLVCIWLGVDFQNIEQMMCGKTRSSAQNSFELYLWTWTAMNGKHHIMCCHYGLSVFQNSRCIKGF